MASAADFKERALAAAVERARIGAEAEQQLDAVRVLPHAAAAWSNVAPVALRASSAAPQPCRSCTVAS